MGTAQELAATAVPSLDDERQRLRALIRLDVSTAIAAVVVILATYVVVVRSEWLLVLAGLVGISGLVMARGLGPADRGDLEGGVRWMAAANWSIALAAASIATFAWPLMVIAALIPAVLAAPYVPTPRLRWYVVASLAVAVGVAAAGLLQDVSGFGDQLPDWVPKTVVILFLPPLAWFVVQTALQNSTRVQAALDEALAANEQLRRSEEALAVQAMSLQASRARLVEATDRERRRVERDLHDGAQQRLVAVGLGLRMAQEALNDDPDSLHKALGVLRDEVHAARSELRDLAHGVYPSVLTQHGLVDALRAAADRCPIPVDVRARALGRFASQIEAAVYFCCVEALQNAAKHAGRDARVELCLEHDGDVLRFSVVDDGVGFNENGGQACPGDGFANMEDRIGAAGGDLQIESTPGQGTAVTGALPVHLETA